MHQSGRSSVDSDGLGAEFRDSPGAPRARRRSNVMVTTRHQRSSHVSLVDTTLNCRQPTAPSWPCLQKPPATLCHLVLALARQLSKCALFHMHTLASSRSFDSWSFKPALFSQPPLLDTPVATHIRCMVVFLHAGKEFNTPAYTKTQLCCAVLSSLYPIGVLPRASCNLLFFPFARPPSCFALTAPTQSPHSGVARQSSQLTARAPDTSLADFKYPVINTGFSEEEQEEEERGAEEDVVADAWTSAQHDRSSS